MSSAIKKLPNLFLLILFFISCKQNAATKTDFSNSGKHAFSLIKICVDILLTTEPKMNTKNYVVNLSGYKSLGLDKSGVDSFIKIKEAILPATLDDSSIISNGVYSYMKQSMLINFRKITVKENGIVVVEANKFKSEEKIEIELTLSREKDGYFFLSARELKQ